MRRAARRDENEPEVILALSAMPCVVTVSSFSVKGVPDLLVAVLRRGGKEVAWLWMEVKAPRRGRLEPAQVKWWQTHHGPGVVADSPAAARAAVDAFSAGDTLTLWGWWRFAPAGSAVPQEALR